jgi:carbonic anhydrase/acetyltransferase-like protein (isoleucine patch superfamily)
MLVRSCGAEPAVHSSVFVAPTAVLVGRVRVDERSRVMYGAVLDSEGSKVEIGVCTIVCENAVLRGTSSGDTDHPVLVGDHVLVGPHATLLGCTVEPYSYVATSATILHGATVRSGAVVAVGALVHARAVVPSGFFVPPNTVAIGDPVELYGADDKEALAEAIRSLGFVKSAFGLEPNWEDRTATYREATEVRSKEFERHFEDIVLS